ncbi:MAG: HAD family hydrolase [Phycisphaerae bacterium]|jgi:HAD superfamily hydrolase (TIGR01549 family)
MNPEPYTLNPIKAVCFDLGETLLNFGQVNAVKLFNVGAKLTYDYLKSRSQPVGQFKSYSRRNLNAIRWRYWLSLLTANDFDARELFKKINQPRGIRLADPQWDELIWLWYEPLSKCATVETDIKETLAELKNMNLTLAILSNTFINDIALEKQLTAFGMLEYFDIRMYSYQFPYRKPNKRIFRAAAKRIDLPPENIMFVGDKIYADIRPAMKLGMTAVLKRAYTNIRKIPPKSAYIIEKLSELPNLIRQINTSAQSGK